MDLIPLYGDLDAASAALGVTATPWLADEAWLWRIRLEQVARDPASLAWIARAAVVPGSGVVGHAGFHGPPDLRPFGLEPAGEQWDDEDGRELPFGRPAR